MTEHVNGASAAPTLDRPRLDPAALHGLAGEFVRMIEDLTEADPAALLCHVLPLAGSAAGRGTYRTADGSKHYLNLFVAVVGPTSDGRKGTALNYAIEFMRRVDPSWASGCIRNGLVSGEGVIYAVRDPAGCKVEGKIEDPGASDKRLCVVESELAAVLRVCQRAQNNLSATLRDFWDGKEVVATMAKNAPAVATAAHVTVIGHITPDELKRNLTTTEIANGFGNRFLWLYVARSKILPFGGEGIAPGALESLAVKFRRALEFSRRGGELGFAPDAREIWISVYESLTKSKPGLLGHILARAAAQVLRLSSLYAMLDCSREISLQHLLAALALWSYTKASARKLFGDLTGDADADAILSTLRSQHAGLTRTEISNLFARNLSALRIERALAALLSFELIRFQEERTSGRSSQRWFAITKN